MFKFVLINLAFVICALLHGACADCHVCNAQNGVVCISTRKYQKCVNGIADTSMTFSCKADNEICTENSVVCMEETLNSISPACVDTSNCGKCQGKEDDKKFICTSRSTFDTCIDGKPTGMHTICPENQLCDANLGKQKQNPCVSSDKEAQIELCEKVIDKPDDTATAETSSYEGLTTTPTYIGVSAIREDADTNVEITMTTLTSAISTTSMSTTTTVATSIPTSTTLATPAKITTTTFTTPLPTSSISATTTKQESTTTKNPADLICPQEIMTGRYPHPTDTTCRSYIYCYRHYGEMKTIVYNCPPFHFFNPSIRSCIPVKPDGCM